MEQLEQDIGKLPSPGSHALREQELDALGAAMPAAPLSAALAEGRQVTLADAFAAVLRDELGR